MDPRILHSDEENPNLSIGEDSAGSLSAMELLDGCSNGGGQVEEEERKKKNNNNDGKKKRNKKRFLWTDSLRSKFITAVDQLGGPEKAIPSEIMRAMNVHGLTRLIVASHLQKYRAQRKGVVEREQVAVPISPLPLSEDGPNKVSSSERGGILKQNRRKKNHTDEISNADAQPKIKKARFSWTPNKQKKFVAAIESIGLENTVPKKIMDAMGIEGLNRHIIASHLQKYRAKRKGVKEREQVAVPISPLPLSEDGPNQVSSSERGGILNQNRRKKNHTDEISNADAHPNIKKARFSWTPNTQKKFIAAIESIGLGNALPKKILDAMGIEGLSMHIIASHLKKYRIQLKKEMESQQLKKEKERQQLTFII